MLNTNNTYFENIKRLGHEYEAARVERKARKEQIIAAHGWDSEELKAWYAEDNAAKFPFPQAPAKPTVPGRRALPAGRMRSSWTTSFGSRMSRTL